MVMSAGDVAVGLTDERGVDVPVTTTDNSDGSFTVEYEPKSHGCFSVLTYFAEKPVPQSPIKVNVQPGVDVTGVTVHHLDPRQYSLSMSAVNNRLTHHMI